MSRQKPSWKRLSPPQIPEYILNEFCHRVRTLQWEPGYRCQTLEKRIARELGVPPEWVLSTYSCTAALAVAQEFLLRDKIAGYEPAKICPLTYAATYVYLETVAKNTREQFIEWIDCDNDGWPINTVDVAVELWGRPVPDRVLPVTVLDSAHRVLDPRHGELLRQRDSLGASHGAGAVCYSFNCQKEIPCLHGGAVVSPYVTDEWRRWLYCGTRSRVYQGGGGIKGYLNDPLAAWITKGIGRLPVSRRSRQRVLARYKEMLGSLVVTGDDASGHLCVLRFTDPGHRKLVQSALSRYSVEHSVHYSLDPILFKDSCPNAVGLSERIITVPCHPEMSNRDVDRVARLVISA